MSDDFIWWLVLVVALICAISIPGLLQVLWEEIKKDYFNDDK